FRTALISAVRNEPAARVKISRSPARKKQIRLIRQLLATSINRTWSSQPDTIRPILQGQQSSEPRQHPPLPTSPKQKR
ncbi:hypothetical protein, partial [Azotobacter salinestris]|uniref:hypothetical protein n=1 Tax=Azotobacter salinestris TaxID=69964 RepID=UPI0032DE44DE